MTYNKEACAKYRACHPDRKKKSSNDTYMKYKDKYKTKREATKEVKKLYHREWYRNNKDKMYFFNIKRLYGLDKEEFFGLLEQQDYKCAICECDLTSLPRKKVNVDHDHNTKKVRGVLCNLCNSLLGYAHDSIETLRSAMDYLEKTNNDE